jgi:hypothetical protein
VSKGRGSPFSFSSFMSTFVKFDNVTIQSKNH